MFSHGSHKPSRKVCFAWMQKDDGLWIDIGWIHFLLYGLECVPGQVKRGHYPSKLRMLVKTWNSVIIAVHVCESLICLAPRVKEKARVLPRPAQLSLSHSNADKSGHSEPKLDREGVNIPACMSA